MVVSVILKGFVPRHANKLQYSLLFQFDRQSVDHFESVAVSCLTAFKQHNIRASFASSLSYRSSTSFYCLDRITPTHYTFSAIVRISSSRPSIIKA
jgi:hypothetical protein